MELILGSQSPRRRELLGRMGLEFTVLTAEIDETKYETEDPEESVCRICREKAYAVANRLWLDNCQLSTVNCQLVLTADTIVVLDGKIMGKPHDEAEARAMLRALSGREHAVFTAFTLLPVGSDPLIAPVIAAGNDAAVPAAGGIRGCLPTISRTPVRRGGHRPPARGNGRKVCSAGNLPAAFPPAP